MRACAVSCQLFFLNIIYEPKHESYSSNYHRDLATKQKDKEQKKIRRRKRQGTNIGSITSTHKQTK
jgi:hypothetical protein